MTESGSASASQLMVASESRELNARSTGSEFASQRVTFRRPDGPLPAPDRPVLRIHHIGRFLERQLLEYAAGGVALGERVRAHDSYLGPTRARYLYQGRRHRSRDAASFLAREREVGDLHRPVGIRPAP